MTKGERAIEAIESHLAEVYGDQPPNFIWDVEMYQAIGLLPDDFKIPTQDELNGTIYAFIQAFKEVIDPDLDKDGYLLQSCCVCYGGDSFPSKMKEALKCCLSILKSRMDPLVKQHENKFKQLSIAFGKHLSGFKPGDAGWTELDDQAMMWGYETTEDFPGA